MFCFLFVFFLCIDVLIKYFLWLQKAHAIAGRRLTSEERHPLRLLTQRQYPASISRWVQGKMVFGNLSFTAGVELMLLVEIHACWRVSFEAVAEGFNHLFSLPVIKVTHVWQD